MTDRHTDVQRETIIPHHYCVGGYKKLPINSIIWCNGLLYPNSNEILEHTFNGEKNYCIYLNIRTPFQHACRKVRASPFYYLFTCLKTAECVVNKMNLD